MQHILLKLRQKLNLSQSKIANQLGVSQRTYSYWEKEGKIPRKLYFKKIKDLVSSHLTKKDLEKIEILEEQLYDIPKQEIIRYDIPKLLLKQRRLKAENARLKNELKYYKKWYKDFNKTIGKIRETMTLNSYRR